MSPEPGGRHPRRTGVRGRRWFAGLAAFVLLAGCGGEVLTAGEVTVLVGARADAGMDALASGRLSVVGGCLGVEDVVVVWPHGTEVVEEDPLRVEVPGAGTAGLGERVRVAGGFVVEHEPGSAGDAGAVEVGGVTVPAPCARHDVFLAH